MGEAGRQFVLENYEWKENADRMERLYRTVVNDYKNKRGKVSKILTIVGARPQFIKAAVVSRSYSEI